MATAGEPAPWCRARVFASKGGLGSDSDEEALLTGAEERRASAALLRFKLRRWDRSFLAQHGRKATYEDRKLDRGYQELRARLRAVDTEHEREKDRVPLKPQRCLSPMASTRRSSAARATAGGATAGDTTRRTGHTDDSGTRMPNLAEKEKMETFLAGVQAHVATNHNRAFLAAALGAEIAQTTMEYNPENLFGFDSRPALPHYVQDGALRRRAELRQDHRHAVYHNMSKRCEMAEREAARAAKEAELRARLSRRRSSAFTPPASTPGGTRRSSAAGSGRASFAAASRRASGTPIASALVERRRQRRLRHACCRKPPVLYSCRHAWWRRLQSGRSSAQLLRAAVRASSRSPPLSPTRSSPPLSPAKGGTSGSTRSDIDSGPRGLSAAELKARRRQSISSACANERARRRSSTSPPPSTYAPPLSPTKGAASSRSDGCATATDDASAAAAAFAASYVPPDQKPARRRSLVSGGQWTPASTNRSSASGGCSARSPAQGSARLAAITAAAACVANPLWRQRQERQQRRWQCGGPATTAWRVAPKVRTAGRASSLPPPTTLPRCWLPPQPPMGLTPWAPPQTPLPPPLRLRERSRFWPPPAPTSEEKKARKKKGVIFAEQPELGWRTQRAPAQSLKRRAERSPPSRTFQISYSAPHPASSCSSPSTGRHGGRATDGSPLRSHIRPPGHEAQHAARFPDGATGGVYYALGAAHLALRGLGRE